MFRVPFTVNIALSLWLATVGNLALWRALYALPEVEGWKGLWLCLATGVVIAAALYMLLSMFAWRWTLKLLGTVCLLAAASGSYFMLAYGVILDTPMMTNMLATDTREVRDLINWRFAATVLILGVLPTVWLWRRRLSFRPMFEQLGRNLAGLLVAMLVLAAALFSIAADFVPLHRNHMAIRSLVNPLSSFYSLAEIATQPLWGRKGPVRPIGEDAVVGKKSQLTTAPAPLIVLVVGETARAGNFGLNGYPRDTTPELLKLARTEHLFSHAQVWSCGTSTEASLPCMFSHLGKSAYESSKARYESLLDVLQRAGMAVLWVDNQSGCKGVCDRVVQASTVGANDSKHCIGGECHDSIMLEGLDARIAALPPQLRAKGVVVVLHQMGSHGPAYYKRSMIGHKAFQPECTNTALASCAVSEVVNAYDNSIRATDQFLTGTVKWLQAYNQKALNLRPEAMMYVADHGESLGENNLYLHGLPYAVAPDVQKQVPWITWLSRDYMSRTKLNAHCLQERVQRRMSHDNYFHTVLGLASVETQLYKKELDVYAACR